jgi:hypothetical protein
MQVNTEAKEGNQAILKPEQMACRCSLRVPSGTLDGGVAGRLGFASWASFSSFSSVHLRFQ